MKTKNRTHLLALSLAVVLSFATVAPLFAQADPEEAAASKAVESVTAAQTVASESVAQPAQDTTEGVAALPQTVASGAQDAAASAQKEPVAQASSAPHEEPVAQNAGSKAAAPQTQKLRALAASSSGYAAGTLTIADHETGTLSAEIAAVKAITPFDASEVTTIIVTGAALDDDDFVALGSNANAQTVDISQTATTTIPDQAFLYNFPLITIDLPTTCTSIGTEAFRNCARIKNVNGTDNVKTIGDGAFAYTRLETVAFPSATSVGARAFWETSLQTASFPSVIDIGQWAFWGSTDLTSIDIPNAVTIGKAAFDQCTSLMYIYLPKATLIDQAAFYNTALTAAYIPSVETIGYEAFGECTDLRYIVMGDIPVWTQSSSWPPVQNVGRTFTNVPEDAVLFHTGSGDSAAIGWKNNVDESVDRPTIRYDVRPTPLAIDLGHTATYSLGVASAGLPTDLLFGWEHNGSPLAGETKPTLSVYPVHVSSEGEYLGYAVFPYTTDTGAHTMRVDFKATSLLAGPLTLDPPGPFSVKVGKTVMTVPSYAPVGIDPATLWTYDHSMLSATFTYVPPADDGIPAYSTVTFTGLKVGTTTVTYSAGGRTVDATITVTDDGSTEPTATPTEPTSTPAPTEPTSTPTPQEPTTTPTPAEPTTTPTASGSATTPASTKTASSSTPLTGDIANAFLGVLALGSSASLATIGVRLRRKRTEKK